MAGELAEAVAALEAAGVDAPRHDAEALLAHVLDVSRSRLASGRELSAEQLERYRRLVERRAGREPLQHIVGSAPFRYVEVEVGPGVFVPRPETELLAGWAIDVLRDLPISARRSVVDLGTGSGAIALALATEVPEAAVHAVELDGEAFAYAQRNLTGTGVDLRHGDMAHAFADLDGTVDVVVSNPPYIPLDAYDAVQTEARDHDPAAALWSGADGLDAIREVERVAARLLRPGGWVGCEHADAQGESAPAVFSGSGRWSGVRDNLDLAGRLRFVTARRV
ncbi:MAG: peptide chain release factor N(5)-glutamine methyltransferase [Propionibacteriales bacterium]|nr:peptide chain release factor N(5)-glutamine methyltransferase [Propionibacteriales bacterium]